MSRSFPEWFTLLNTANPATQQRIDGAVTSLNMTADVVHAPLQAYWFIYDSLYLASEANEKGMHANALSLTRQCIEALGVIELGICGRPGSEQELLKWNNDKLTPGNLRNWLQQNVWNRYGSGLWNEPWTQFMGQFAKAIQPYAHYGRDLAQWQTRLIHADGSPCSEGTIAAIVEIKRHAYDPQKATRITLYHALLTYVLGRIWIASNPGDTGYEKLITNLGLALAKSRYLDGNATDWAQQFWAMLWEGSGKIILE